MGCCRYCFVNESIQGFIESHFDFVGDCDYCGKKHVNIILEKKLGNFLRKRIELKYEYCDEGTGVMYDSEDKQYIGPDGEQAFLYSVREVLTDEYAVFSDDTNAEELADAVFDATISYEERKDGDFNIFSDLDAEYLAVKDDLYGYEITNAFISWELFKHTILHYNRFFDIGSRLRKDYLDVIQYYLSDFEKKLPTSTTFFRARRLCESISNLNSIDPISELGPAPSTYATTNRMSPAGISYLYLADTVDTTFAECRLKNTEAIVGRFVLKQEIRIIDLTTNLFSYTNDIFNDKYKHENRWVGPFLSKFVEEISQPVKEEEKDHSYEYAPTQVIAEYIRSLGFDGIAYNSSVGKGKSFVFFYGPDTKHSPNAYPYPFDDPYIGSDVRILNAFTDIFSICSASKYYVESDSVSHKIQEIIY